MFLKQATEFLSVAYKELSGKASPYPITLSNVGYIFHFMGFPTCAAFQKFFVTVYIKK